MGEKLRGPTTWKVNTVNSCVFIDDAETGKNLLQHNARPGLRPYIHPLRGPDGRSCLTEDSPFHHPWQHGVQTGYHGVNGCDFWFDPGQVSGSRIGTIEPRTTQIEEIEPPQWSIETLWRDDGGVGLLRENQIWKLTGHDGLLYLDLEWMVQAMLRNVHIEKSTYGGLFIRMPFRRDRPCRVVNSAGQEEDDTEQSPAAWVHLEMTVNEGDLTAGIAVLDHPDNPRHPAHWRVDSQRGINPSPCIPAAIDLAADAKMVHRYRLILHSGTLASQEVEGHWQRYAHS